MLIAASNMYTSLLVQTPLTVFIVLLYYGVPAIDESFHFLLDVSW